MVWALRSWHKPASPTRGATLHGHAHEVTTFARLKCCRRGLAWCGVQGLTARHVINAGLFVRVFQKSILNRVCQLLAIRAHKMAPRTSQGLQERAWDTPT